MIEHHTMDTVVRIKGKVLSVDMEGFLGNILREGNIESSHFCLGIKDTQDTHIYALPSKNGPVCCRRHYQ